MRVVLFGSYARANYTIASDVDLLVVYKGRERKEAYAVVKSTVDVFGLEPHVYSQTHCSLADTLKNWTRRRLPVSL